jgi:hypothetical protein
MFICHPFQDAPFALYETARWQQYYLRWFSLILFIVAIYMHHPYIDDSVDVKPRAAENDEEEEEDDDDYDESQIKAFGSLKWSRYFVYAGSFFVMLSSMIESFPDYIGAANLHQALPSCAPQFDLMMHTIFRSLVGTLASAVCVGQMFGILLSLAPTLARVSFLTLLQNKHLDEGAEDRSEVLRMLLVYSTVFTPISTCLPATLICQMIAPDDILTSYLWLLFWLVPPANVFLWRMTMWATTVLSNSPEKSVDSASYLIFLSSYITMFLYVIRI